MMPGYTVTGGSGGMMTWVFVSSLIFSLIFLALIGVAVWAFVRWVNARTSGPAQGGPYAPATGASAAEILRQRYARGEIDADTFAQMRATLEASGAEVQPLGGNGRGAPTTATR